MDRPAELDKVSGAARLAAAWTTLFVIGTDLFVVSPMLPAIAADYSISTSAAGLSVAAFAFAYMLAAPCLGQLADRIGRRRILVGCLAGFVFANALSAVAPTFAAFVLSRALAGGMAAGVSPTVYALVSDGAPTGRRATWLGIAVSGLLTALSLGTPLGALAADAFGWSGVFFALALAAAGLIWVSVVVWPAGAAPALEKQAFSNPAALAPRLGLTVLWSTSLYGMYTYLGVGLSDCGYTAEQLAQTIFLYGLGAILGNLAGGCLADRIGERVAIGASLLGLCCGLLALRCALETGPLVGPALFLASAAAQVFFPTQQAALAAEFSARRAVVLALNNSALFLGISLGSVVGAQAVAYGGFAFDLLLCAGLAFAGWIVQSLVAARFAQPGPETITG